MTSLRGRPNDDGRSPEQIEEAEREAKLADVHPEMERAAGEVAAIVPPLVHDDEDDTETPNDAKGG